MTEISQSVQLYSFKQPTYKNHCVNLVIQDILFQFLKGISVPSASKRSEEPLRVLQSLHVDELTSHVFPAGEEVVELFVEKILFVTTNKLCAREVTGFNTIFHNNKHLSYRDVRKRNKQGFIDFTTSLHGIFFKLLIIEIRF